MLGFLRFLVIGFVLLTVLYGLLSVYIRSLTRERLEHEWDDTRQGEGSIAERDAYVEEGIKAYERSFKPRLLLLVYILPLIVFAAIFYVTNFL